MADRHSEMFREEAHELLSELETSLLELEERPDDRDVIGRVFRAMHTIKGSGSMFGFVDVATFTHEVETVFDHVRNGRLRVTKDLIDLTLAARDHIRSMLETANGGTAASSPETGRLVAAFRSLLGSEDGKEAEAIAVKAAAGTGDERASEMTYRVRFRPPEDIFFRGLDPVMMVREVLALGDGIAVAHTDRMPQLSDLDPERCYTYWDIILTTDRGINAVRDIFIFIEDEAEVAVETIAGAGSFNRAAGYKRLGEILVEKGDVSLEALTEALSGQKKLGELLVEMDLVTPDKVRAALAEQQHVKEVQERRRVSESRATVKVPSEKLDRLVNLVGELVTVQAHLSQVAGDEGNPLLSAIAEEVERLTSELRDNTMSIRMLPIGTTFDKFRRLVRDLSAELGKEIYLVTEGAETELDKTVIEKLNDPLVHLIRNAIDHGIERPEDREQAGKARVGTIRLSAVHSGSHVFIVIQDDGAGLDTEAIREKAAANGLISADARLPEKEVQNLIFAPGFSTAKTITSVSGRGVGMDVVKQAIESLRGSIEIESKRGRGSTMILKLPLTLAIIEGLLVRIAEDFFVFPLSSVRECIELTRADVEAAHGRRLVNVRGRIVPYVSMRDLFMKNGDAPEVQQVVIAELDGQRTGFAVDMVVGQHQTVIKSLGTMYRLHEGVSGATILGDGSVALILDLAKLVRTAECEEAGRLAEAAGPK